MAFRIYTENTDHSLDLFRLHGQLKHSQTLLSCLYKGLDMLLTRDNISLSIFDYNCFESTSDLGNVRLLFVKCLSCFDDKSSLNHN